MTPPSRSSYPLRAALGAGLLGFAAPALAYLDPSTGSMILSAIIGMLATAGLALKTYWYKLKGFFRGSQPPPSASRTARDEQHPGAEERGPGRTTD